MENGFKTYVNQYSTNMAALTKSQRNEERDKKRHLSHKFSLTQASEFKWAGSFYGKLFVSFKINFFFLNLTIHHIIQTNNISILIMWQSNRKC